MGTASVSNGGRIRFAGITKKYGELTVVDDINLDIAPGEFFSLLGPSGSGKTTTLMMLAGFAMPDSGQILLDEADISYLSPQQRNLGMVFQNYALFPHMSVLENVMFPLKVRKFSGKECLERAQWAIDLVRLSSFAKRLPKELSGGQQQRVALARAVVFHPRVVLMDEPLGALDKNLRYQMQMEIKELQRKLNMTVVFVTHDQEEAMNMSDRIAIMNNGSIEQLGRPKEVYESPRNVFAAGFLGEANILPYSRLAVDYRQRMGMQDGDHLFIRPERVVLAPLTGTMSQSDSGLTGCIRNVSFLGSIVRYQIGLDDEFSIYADSANLSDMRSFDVGDSVAIGWKQASDIRIINHG
ncbi:ABC transporter ATP-binding protein [Allopusillimonas ginsengisoli]|uniref:ABC transporter ATP-binding protein n=1 Tax=Allopusillimonas ginsengisoli TaxID=453575 RepID=UPI0010227CD8|nr:ABC transporter ATP-binding protein [Allopusillimonas ginsengisoli]TEA79013.1 ABC transporter ATP-binding protein [Allopusillimonas ginsengisoli]